MLGIFLLVSLVSIGYSALSSSLMVTGEANFRVREDVRITGLKVLSTSNSGGETYPSEYYKDGTKVMVTLPNLNSTITYQVEVTNNTKVDYYLKSKTDATNSNTAMKYTLSGASDDKTPIKANAKSTFNIVISYNTGTLPSNKNLTLETRFVFDILDVTPPTVTFNPTGGEYKEFQTVRITASDANYSKMDVEVRDGNNTKIEVKSKTGITTTTYDVSLDAYGTYKILVKAYDKRGNTQTNTPLENGYTYQQYVIKNPSAAEDLKAKANPNNLTYTDSTVEQKRQMYAFEHEATDQTGALTDYRYIGNDPYNYVYFNCKSEPQNASNCETWRIIGIFSVDDGKGNIEERMKITRGGSLKDSMAWDDGEWNDWTRASLNAYFNDTYYNKLSAMAQGMIENSTYYLGGTSGNYSNSGQAYYNLERGNEVYSGNFKSWVGKIGLMYPSDYTYTYALGVDDKCYQDMYNGCSLSGTPTNSWLYNSNKNDETSSVAPQWLMTPASDASRQALLMYGKGYIGPYNVEYTGGVRPVLYLKTNISRINGDGSAKEPYQLYLPLGVSFSAPSGTYAKMKKITIVGYGSDYSRMEVEVKNSNGIIADKSNSNVLDNTYTVTLEEEGTYTISVKAYDKNNGVFVESQQYTIKDIFSDYLKLHANADNIAIYGLGSKQEMYSFKHERTTQTKILMDYRYIGDAPNNYVYFNCTNDSDVSTCEKWRIIGVFPVENENGYVEDRVKIIRGSSFKDRMTYDDRSSNWWERTSLSTYLNETYYGELSETARKMTEYAKYYLGVSGGNTFSGSVCYKGERGTSTSRPANWIGKIGLMYPSDYLYTYALYVNTKCFDNGNFCDTEDGADPKKGWLYNSNYSDDSTSITTQWTIAPRGITGNEAFFVDGSGNMYRSNSGIYYNTSADNYYGIRPSLYLSSKVSRVNGDGSSDNPYQITIQ